MSLFLMLLTFVTGLGLIPFQKDTPLDSQQSVLLPLNYFLKKLNSLFSRSIAHVTDHVLFPVKGNFVEFNHFAELDVLVLYVHKFSLAFLVDGKRDELLDAKS
jgi:hypothetical protein